MLGGPLAVSATIIVSTRWRESAFPWPQGTILKGLVICNLYEAWAHHALQPPVRYAIHRAHRHLAVCTPSTAWTLGFAPNIFDFKVAHLSELFWKYRRSRASHILISFTDLPWVQILNGLDFFQSNKNICEAKHLLKKCVRKKKNRFKKKKLRYLSMQGIVFSEDHCLHAGHFCPPNCLDTSLLASLTS